MHARAGDERIERLQRIERHELRHPGVAELGDVGLGLADVSREQFFVGGGPGDLLRADVHAGVGPFKVGEHLLDHFAFAPQAPELELDARRGRAAGQSGADEQSTR